MTIGPIPQVAESRRISEQILEESRTIAVAWIQLGIVDEEAADKARAQGIDVVMDRCTR